MTCIGAQEVDTGTKGGRKEDSELALLLAAVLPIASVPFGQGAFICKIVSDNAYIPGLLRRCSELMDRKDTESRHRLKFSKEELTLDILLPSLNEP